MPWLLAFASLSHSLHHALHWFTHFSEHVQRWMYAGGYFVLFGLLFACGLGLPLPEDIPLLVAGAMVATGKMHLAIAAICAWCGIIGGDIVLYHLGKKFGLEITRIPVIGSHLTRQRIEEVHGMFERWGVWVVAIGRLFAGIRGAMVVVAGTIRFTFWKFLVADGLAAVVSGGAFLALGYLFGHNMRMLRAKVEEAKGWALLGVLVLAAGIGVWLFIRSRRAPHEPETPRDAKEPAATPASTPIE